MENDMKVGEFKIRVSNSIMNMIDTYFGGNTLNEKFINSTLKIILKQNIYKIDPMLELFTDKNGEINAADIIAEYANIIDEKGYVFDLKQYIDSDAIKKFIPDKILVIKREDILNLLN
jgi:hypothetical protein